MSLTLETFRGDLETLSSMMRASWRENKSSVLAYEPPFLRSVLNYPGTQPELAVSAVDGSELAGFIVATPRQMSIAGTSRKVALISLLTTVKHRKGGSLGIVVWRELVERLMALGFDACMNFSEDGVQTNGLTKAIAAAYDLEVTCLRPVRFLIKVLPQPPAGEVDSAPVDTDLLISKSAALSHNLPLARLWSPEEARYQYTERDRAVAVSTADEGGGFIGGYVQNLEGEGGTAAFIIDDVLIDGLSPASASALLTRALHKAALTGAGVAVVPETGLVPSELFQRAGFRRSGRVMNVYLTRLKSFEIPLPPYDFYSEIL